jgi:hypothetical protein
MKGILAHCAQPSAISHQLSVTPTTKSSSRLQSTVMSPAKTTPSVLSWLLVPARVLLVSFLLALLAFAVCLLLGILGLVISTGLRGVHPNMTLAYRAIAFPAAIVAGSGALVAAIVLEVRHGREERSM